MSLQSKNAKAQNFVTKWEKKANLWKVFWDKYKDQDKNQESTNQLMKMFFMTRMLFFDFILI